MEQNIYLDKQLRNMKILFGFVLVGLFFMMYEVLNYVNAEMGIGYLTLIIGVAIIAWGISDHLKIKKREIGINI